MLNKSLILLTALCAVACHSAYVDPHGGGDDPAWNRSVEALSVARGDNGESRATAFFSVQAENVVEPVDLSTRVDLMAAGEVVDTLLFDITAQPPGTASFGCGTCPPGQLCWVIDGIQAGCGEPPLLCDPFQALDLPTGDLAVRLTPAGDGVAEIDRADDRGSLRFDGGPVLGVTGASGSAVERLTLGG